MLTALTGLLALTVSIFASVGRGYLVAFGGLIGLIVAAQVAFLAGAGAWFPLSSPAFWAAGASATVLVSIGQLALVPIVSLAVASATVVWWQKGPLYDFTMIATLPLRNGHIGLEADAAP